MTPRELNLLIDAYADRVKAEGEERLMLAYLTARWSRAANLPDFHIIKARIERAQALAKKPKKEQTPQQMLEFLIQQTQPESGVE